VAPPEPPEPPELPKHELWGMSDGLGSDVDQLPRKTTSPSWPGLPDSGRCSH
jgi:hypothetical protein